MLMAKVSASTKVPSRLLALRRLKSTSGGSSETELNELQVRPTGCPSAVRGRDDGHPGREAAQQLAKQLGLDGIDVRRRMAHGVGVPWRLKS